jgi:SAM-dependent methyltransferase
MLTDHSKTYRLSDIRNIVHVMRLRAILRIIEEKITNPVDTYADYGCSNGFITSKIAGKLKVRVAEGFDYTDNVLVGAQLHPEIRFARFNLNVVNDVKRYDLVTCFETIEHVGNMEIAIQNVCRSRAPGGLLLVTVPIEIGWIGFLKYVIKRLLFRYDLPLACSDWQYTVALLKGDRIKHFRHPAEGYGTHFGFDYRDVDDLLRSRGDITFDSWNFGSTRFYLVRDC